MPADRDADYPIEEYMAFQRREWISERIGWCLLILIALVALSGLLAYGPLSRAHATDTSHRLSIEYDRFERITVATHLTLRVAAPTAPFAIRLGSDFTSHFELDSVEPRPQRSTQGRDGLVLTFDPPPGGDFTAVLWYRPRRAGLVEFSAALDAEPLLRRNIVIYP